MSSGNYTSVPSKRRFLSTLLTALIAASLTTLSLIALIWQVRAMVEIDNLKNAATAYWHSQHLQYVDIQYTNSSLWDREACYLISHPMEDISYQGCIYFDQNRIRHKELSVVPRAVSASTEYAFKTLQ